MTVIFIFIALPSLNYTYNYTNTTMQVILAGLVVIWKTAAGCVGMVATSCFINNSVPNYLVSAIILPFNYIFH